MNSAIPPSRSRVLPWVAALLLTAGVLSNWNVVRAPGGVDFPSLYVMGRGITEGVNIYARAMVEDFSERYQVDVPSGMFYPPATGFVMAPFALLPYQAAKFAWFLVTELTLVLGVQRLVKVAAPRAGSHVWMFCAALVLFSASIRWGMMLLQGAPLAVGLLCWLTVALHERRTTLAVVVSAIAVVAKMTLSLPFVGLLLLQRRYIAAVASVGAWGALNGLGFWRMGGFGSSFVDYRENIGLLEAFGDINSPDPWDLQTRPRLDWTTLFYGLSGELAAARIASLGLGALVSLWLLREWLRNRPPIDLSQITLFMSPLVCLGSLLVYHHHYDAAPFLVPALLGYFVLGREARPRWAVLAQLPLLAICVLLPMGLAQNVLQALMGDFGVGVFKLAFPVATSLALLGSMAMLTADSRRRAGAGGRALAEAPVGDLARNERA